MTDKDAKVWDECHTELDKATQKNLDGVLAHTTASLKNHTEAYNQSRGLGSGPDDKGKGVHGIGKQGAKELLIALMREGFI